jgi:hypothetical protein
MYRASILFFGDIIIIITIIITAIGFSLCRSSTNKNKYILTIQYKNTKHSNKNISRKQPHITHLAKTTTAQDTHQMKQSQYNHLRSAYGHPNVHGTFVPKNFTVTHFTSLKVKTKSLRLYYEQQMHSNLTNYHTPTRFDIIGSTSRCLNMWQCDNLWDNCAFAYNKKSQERWRCCHYKVKFIL